MSPETRLQIVHALRLALADQALHATTRDECRKALALALDARPAAEELLQIPSSILRKEMTVTSDYRPLVCGTRRTEKRGPSDFRVVCATCGAGGTVRHDTHDSAEHAAVRDSVRSCRACGAS